MSEPFIAEIKMFGGNFAPRSFADCSGQLLPISQNQALFSLLGTIYGGDGRTTFALPDLRSRVPMHTGQGPGLSNRVQGARAGQENVTLTTGQIPAHSHIARMRANANEGNSADPTNRFPAAGEEPNSPYNAQAANADMAAGSVVVDNAGGNQSHDNMPPFLVIRFIIALVGIFPSRN